jgi:hypothetical protein
MKERRIPRKRVAREFFKLGASVCELSIRYSVPMHRIEDVLRRAKKRG